MRILVTDFMSLDGVVQAPGGSQEDPHGGFAHGGWSGAHFDPEVMGPVIAEALADRMNEIPKGGKRVFPDDGRARGLELVSVTPGSTGVLVCRYRSAGR